MVNYLEMYVVGRTSQAIWISAWLSSVWRPLYWRSLTRERMEEVPYENRDIIPSYRSKVIIINSLVVCHQIFISMWVDWRKPPTTASPVEKWGNFCHPLVLNHSFGHWTKTNNDCHPDVETYQHNNHTDPISNPDRGLARPTWKWGWDNVLTTLFITANCPMIN